MVARIGETALKYNIDVELLQEIMHVYSARGARRFGFEIFDILVDLFPDPLPIGLAEIVAARVILERYPAPFRPAMPFMPPLSLHSVWRASSPPTRLLAKSRD